jgi:hypothetical protein
VNCAGNQAETRPEPTVEDAGLCFALVAGRARGVAAEPAPGLAARNIDPIPRADRYS